MVDPKNLRAIPFFADLDDDELAIVAEILHRKEFKRGDTVCAESEKGSSLYVLKKGEVKACKVAPDGELFTLVVMKDGDIFGEMGFLDDRPHSATLVAISDIEVLMLNRNEFEGLVDTHPWITYKLMRNIVYTVHAIVRSMNTRYMDMLNYMWGRKRGY
jgi:CRP-like cAMP-binding protein